MKSRLLFFLLTSIGFSGIVTSTRGQGRFSIAPTLASSYENLTFRTQLDGATGSGFYTGISGGLTAHYLFNPKWSLSAGLLYNRSSGELRFTNVIETATIKKTVENLQVPLLLNYTSSAKRLSPYFSGGILLNYNYNYRNNATTAHAMLGAGILYRVSSKVGLIVQPTATYRLGQPSNGYSSFNDYQLGLQTQVRISF